jgi:hypothetical protein
VAGGTYTMTNASSGLLLDGSGSSTSGGPISMYIPQLETLVNSGHLARWTENIMKS